MSIYDEIGGKAAVAAAVDGFYVRVLDDEVLAHWFSHTDMARQKTHLRAFLAAAIGGPTVYAGRDMRGAHRGLGITDEAFDHVVGHLVDTLAALEVPTAIIASIGTTLAPLRDLVVERAVAA